MRTIDRYLLREMVWPALAALVAFVVLITGHFLFHVVDMFAARGVGFSTIATFSFLRAPDAAVLALPVATLLGCALGLNRIASDNELVPVLAGGMSGYKLMLPAAILGIIATIASFLLKEYAVPVTDRRAQQIKRDLILQRKALAFEPGKFVEAGDRWVFLPRDVNEATDTLHGLWGIMKRQDDFPWLITAEKAQFRRTELYMDRARFYGFSPPDSILRLTASVNVNLGEIARHVTSGRRMENRSLADLADKRAELDGDSSTAREYAMEMHGRLSLITACLAFALLAVPIIWRFGHGQDLTGIVATLIIAFAYYVVMLGLRVLGGNGVIPVAVAAYSQNVIIVIVALWTMKRL